MNELISLLILFVSIFAFSFGLIQWVAYRQRRLQLRLQQSAGTSTDSSGEFVLGELTPALAGQIPMNGTKQAALQAELREAGFYRPSALMQYAAIRALLVILPLFVAGVLAVLADDRFAGRIALVGLCGAFVGYSFPRVYINSVARARKRQIEKGLPVAVDLLALGLLSGQTVIAALRRVSQETRFSFPALATELEIVREQAELNTLPHALDQWAERARIPEVHNLVVILNQSSKHGSDISAGLMEFSNNFRTNLRQRADAQAGRASFWLVFPSVFFLWVPAFALLVAPIAFEFVHKRQENAELLKKTPITDIIRAPQMGTPTGTPTGTPGPPAP
jgi:tight adherence protein C